MEKFWLKYYPKEIPHEINPGEFKNLYDILTKTTEKYPHNKAVTFMGKSINYKQLEEKSCNLAAFLQQELRLNKGDRVAIMLPNTPQYLIALFACFRLGLIVVNINPLYTPTELLKQINDSGAHTILALENFADRIEKALPEMHIKNVILTRLGDELPFPKGTLVNFAVKYIKKLVPSYHLPHAIWFKSAMKKGQSLKLNYVDVSLEDPAFFQYTGGTTGVPKGAVLTHRNLVANVLQGYWFTKHHFVEGESVFILPLPLYHIYALCLSLFLVISGFEDILIANPRDIGGLIKEMKKSKFNALIGLNTLFHALLMHKDFKTIKFPKNFVTIAGGMSTKETVAAKWHEVTGYPIFEGYGLTEASPLVSLNLLSSKLHTGTVGLPLPSMEIDIRDDEGNSLPIGKPGELYIRGPNIMREYWNKPEETANVFAEEGWLKTGDIACLNEDGTIKILDRKKDMVIVSGFNVYPNEIEEVLHYHPGVAEAAVIGVADEHSGEKLKAFIVRKNPDLTPEDLREHCLMFLTHYKCPSIFVFRSELPKSAVGKVLRKNLRNEEIVLSR